MKITPFFFEMLYFSQSKMQNPILTFVVVKFHGIIIEEKSYLLFVEVHK
jgi:hypothetical protein